MCDQKLDVIYEVPCEEIMRLLNESDDDHVPDDCCIVAIDLTQLKGNNNEK